MANKRIKISELPRITYNPNAVGTTVSATSADYLPIAVTDRTNATVKTTMTITTRELMRFVLQQSPPTSTGDDLSYTDDKLVIGRTGFNVEIPNLIVDTVTVTGKSNFEGTTGYRNLDVTGSLTVGDTIQVGDAFYKSRLRDRNNNDVNTNSLDYGIFCSDTNGKIDGKGLSLESLLGLTRVTSATDARNAGWLAYAKPDGKLGFRSLGNVLGSSGAITSNSNYYGNVLSVGSGGELNLGGAGASGLKLSTTTESVNAVSSDLDLVTGTDDNYPVAIAGKSSVTGEPLTAAEYTDHVSYNTTSDALTANASATGDAIVKRTVFKYPIVLSARHENGSINEQHDLTSNDASKSVPAQIGELRWNIYNGVPTLYLAIDTHPDVPGEGGDDSADPNAKIWYGVPLFGTIDDDSSAVLPITAHSYDDND